MDDFLRRLFIGRAKAQTPAETLISVVTIVLGQEEADQEVKRLTALRPADAGCYYAAAATLLADDIVLDRQSGLFAAVRLARFEAARPILAEQVTVVGVFAHEDDAWSVVRNSPPESRQEYAVAPTRIRRI